MGTVTIDELLNTTVSALPQKALIDAYYDGTRYIEEFNREVMIPILGMLLQPSDQEVAVRDVYFKISLMLLRSVLVMNNLSNFQALAMVSRSMFEQWVDLNILANDYTGEAVEKYNDFPEVERYRVAEKLIEFAAVNPTFTTDLSHHRSFVSEPSRIARIGLLPKDKRGRTCFPDHWTNKNLRQRAIDVGREDMYVEVYPLLSWHVHSEATGTAGVSREGLEASFGFCHSIVQRMFLDATSVCAKTTKISSIDYFDTWMQSIALKTSEIITQEQINILQTARRKAGS